MNEISIILLNRNYYIIIYNEIFNEYDILGIMNLNKKEESNITKILSTACDVHIPRMKKDLLFNHKHHNAMYYRSEHDLLCNSKYYYLLNINLKKFNI